MAPDLVHKSNQGHANLTQLSLYTYRVEAVHLPTLSLVQPIVFFDLTDRSLEVRILATLATCNGNLNNQRPR
jgi:hypothetical protein